MKIIAKTNVVFENLNKNLIKIQFLSGNSIKMIAILLMFLDHFSKIVLEWYTNNILFPMVSSGQMTFQTLTQYDYFIRFTLYPIGAIAFPLFCFLISEGYFYTKNRKKYFLLMTIFAIISELPFDIAFFNSYSIAEHTFPFYWKYQNVFFTLLLGMLALWFIEKFRCTSAQKKDIIRSIFIQAAFILILANIASLIHSDYEAYGVLLIVGFYICRKNRFYQMFMLLLMYMITTGNQPTLSQYGSIIILLLYNGKRGKLKLKYFFYIFYPAHMVLLYLINICLAYILT